MPRLTKRDLIERVVAGLQLSGWNVLLLTPPTKHPAKLRIFREHDSLTLKLYIWNVSHGGGAVRPKREFRIQITGLTSLDPDPDLDARTLLLGWFDDLEVFAAFDIARHMGPVAASPSIQIGLDALEAAAADGLAPYNRGNGEIAMGVRPDFLGIYVEHMVAIHAAGVSTAEIDLLGRVARDDSVDEDEIDEAVADPRRRAFMTTLRLVRDRRFRERVLNAYGHRCAFCEMQLDLLDAAHILPVGHPASVDLVSNGIGLCAGHHRAYDHALITFTEGYDIIVNDEMLDGLDIAGLGGGRQQFVAGLRATILMPLSRALRPRRKFVRVANLVRGWS